MAAPDKQGQPPRQLKKQKPPASASPRSLQHLPPELLRAILGYVGASTLAAVARTCHALFPHAVSILWREPPAHVVAACLASTERCHELYRPAVQRLTVCECERMTVAEREPCTSASAPTYSYAPPAQRAIDPLLRWGVFPAVRDLVLIFDPTRKNSERMTARRQRRAGRFNHALDHCPSGGALLTAVRFVGNNGFFSHGCSAGRGARSALTGAAASADDINCDDCIEFSEDVMGVLARRCLSLQALSCGKHLPVVGIERAIKRAIAAMPTPSPPSTPMSASAPTAMLTPRPLGGLRRLTISIMPAEMTRLAALFREHCCSIAELHLHLFSRKRVTRPPNDPLPLVPLADMASLAELSIDIGLADAKLLAQDVQALRALPTGLRKLTLEGRYCKALSMMDGDVAAVVARMPSLVSLRLLIDAPQLTADLLPMVGENCRAIEVLSLPSRCDAAALERWHSKSSAAKDYVLFPQLTRVSVDVLEGAISF
jgi:hypothetical protein